MASVDSDYMLVAAIDFGTTFSGYAFSFRHEFQSDPLKVNSSQWTAGSRSMISLKTATSILFKPDKTFHSFGFEAEDKYSDLVLDDEHRGWYYFRRFKMMLYEVMHLKRNEKLADDQGKEMPAIEVFSAAIKYLKDHLLRHCMDRSYGLKADDIRWVLTVPAIWGDVAKQFMREAAEKAGIHHRNLSIALEPEAASMFCKYLPVERLADSRSGGDITCFKPGQRYLVLDAGGGTVDITVHEVRKDGHIKELHKANGGAWGGTTIDEAFLKFLESITGPRVMQAFRERNKEDFIDFMREFEVKKRTIEPKMDTKITFKVPISLHEEFREIEGGEIRDRIRAMKDIGTKVTFAGDKLRMEAEAVKDLFRETCDKIVHHLKTILAEPSTKGIKTILMVGGFSESPMLRHAVESNFQDTRVIVPQEAGLAVLKGAVIFGHQPKVIISRVSKYTYGLELLREYIPGKDPADKRFYTGRKDLCRHAFEKYLGIGESVPLNDSNAEWIRCAPVSRSQTSAEIRVYASTKENPQYVDDPSCTYLGAIRVDLGQQKFKGDARCVLVQLLFGGTELQVVAVEENTGEITTVSFDFLE